jgi:hypothetical protein
VPRALRRHSHAGFDSRFDGESHAVLVHRECYQGRMLIRHEVKSTPTSLVTLISRLGDDAAGIPILWPSRGNIPQLSLLVRADGGTALIDRL